MQRCQIPALIFTGFLLFLPLRVLPAEFDQQSELPIVFYSASQAQAGKAVFHEGCSSCHSESLGGEHGPPLIGDTFWASWDQKPARALYSLILTSMPVGNQGSLSEKEVLALIAYILEVNGLQAGDRSIDSANQLNKVKLQRPANTRSSPAQ